MKVLKKDVNNDIRYKIVYEEADYERSDDHKLTIINRDDNSEIAHLTFRTEVYSDEFDTEGNELITDIVDDCNPMFIDYLYVQPEYKRMGFATILMTLFLNEFVIDSPCILLKASYGCTTAQEMLMLDNVVLPKFYSDYGFKKIEPDKNYYIINYEL